jgi:Elongation complex protein 6
MAAAPILSKCCLLNTNTSSLTLLKEDAHTDATFLISSVLGHRLRVPNTAIILVCAHQNFQHYSQAGQRLGYNLKQGNNLLIIDQCNGIGDQLESAFVSENLIAKLWQQIEAGVLDAKKNTTSTIDKITIIIDDLVFFKLFGFTDNHLIKLVELLTGLADRHADLAVSVVVKVADFTVNTFLCHHIEERAHVVLDVERLKSGNFKHVDGQILVRSLEDGGPIDGLAGKSMFGQPYTTTDNYDNGKKILYKINERNVKVFMPGEHGLMGGMKI